MPISIQIDHEARTVRATASGSLSAADLRRHLEELVAGGVIAYARVVDCRSASVNLIPEDIPHFVAFIRQLRERFGKTRTAYVSSSDVLYGLMRMYGMMNEQHDPGFAVFRTLEEAEAWIGLDTTES
jgi:hypothetical protein